MPGRVVRRWWAVAAIIVCTGVGWPGPTSAAPEPGGSCTTEGRVRTTKAGVLRCQKSGRRLRWVLTATTRTDCASGGVCAVGDTGPGGGIVFYVHPGGGTFASPGSDCGASCKYLEVAPTASEEPKKWANYYRATGAFATGIGSGYQNTVDIKNQTGNDATYSAVVYAFDYSNNGKTDWHLPSKVELNELCKYAKSQTTGDTSVRCAKTEDPLREGFAPDFWKNYPDAYWSSSEHESVLAYGSAFYAWGQYFSCGCQFTQVKDLSNRVRPVRAF